MKTNKKSVTFCVLKYPHFHTVNNIKILISRIEKPSTTIIYYWQYRPIISCEAFIYRLVKCSKEVFQFMAMPCFYLTI